MNIETQIFIGIALLLSGFALGGIIVGRLFTSGVAKGILGHIVDNTHFYVTPVVLFVVSIYLPQLGKWCEYMEYPKASEMEDGLVFLAGLSGQLTIITLVHGFICSQFAFWSDWSTKQWQEKIAYYAFVWGTLAVLLWWIKPNH